MKHNSVRREQVFVYTYITHEWISLSLKMIFLLTGFCSWMCKLLSSLREVFISFVLLLFCCCWQLSLSATYTSLLYISRRNSSRNAVRNSVRNSTASSWLWVVKCSFRTPRDWYNNLKELDKWSQSSITISPLNLDGNCHMHLKSWQWNTPTIYNIASEIII